MFREFQNLMIQCWVHSGKLGTHQPLLCVQANPGEGTVLLKAIDELSADGPPSTRTLTLNPTKQRKPITTIRILLSPESEELKQMSLTRSGKVATLEFTATGLDAFRESVVNWLKGTADFSLHPIGNQKSRDLKRKGELGLKDLESGELWFWTPAMNP